MPTISVPKEKLEGLPQLPVGRYQFRLDGFSPKKPKTQGATSINLNAQLTVINHPTMNDRKVFNNCNTDFPPAMYDMAHAVGVKFLNEDTDPNPKFPGEFNCKVHGPACDSSDPANWDYVGPLLGQVGELEIVMGDNGKGQQVPKLGRFYCRVPGCTAKHSQSLM